MEESELEEAPAYPVPTRKLFSVEYPGRVVNGARALDNMGGSTTLVQVGCSGRSCPDPSPPLPVFLPL